MSDAEQRRRVVCVLGSPRSGTSLTARMLNLAGVHLGPQETLVEAGRLNARGFWEQREIADLNARIVKALGGTWREPPSPPAGWEASAALAAERAEARSLIDRMFGASALWGWKDPLNCLTLPFWQQLVPEMHYVICLRNPIDVAASGRRGLHRLRPPLTDEEVFGLWGRYTADALVSTSGHPRTFVVYEDCFEQPRVVVDRLIEFAGSDPSTADPASRVAIEAAIEDRLWHHRTAVGEAVGDERMAIDVAALYLMLRLLAVTLPAAPGAATRRARLERCVDLYARRLGEVATCSGS